MIIISYDIADDKMRAHFAKMLKKNGAIRLQFSVYEVQNTKRIVDNIIAKIEAYAKHFTPDDSVIIFDVASDKLTKYGNAITTVHEKYLTFQKVTNCKLLFKFEAKLPILTA